MPLMTTLYQVVTSHQTSVHGQVSAAATDYGQVYVRMHFVATMGAALVQE